MRQIIADYDYSVSESKVYKVLMNLRKSGSSSVQVSCNLCDKIVSRRISKSLVGSSVNAQSNPLHTEFI